MEIIDVLRYSGFNIGSVFREVPFFTDQLMTTILTIDSNSRTTDLNHSRKDRVYYVVSGRGEVTVDNRSNDVREGHLVLIPNGTKYHFMTKADKMVLISFNRVDAGVSMKNTMPNVGRLIGYGCEGTEPGSS